MERVEGAFRIARDALLAERHPGGYWTGELSTSALSTATAVSALSLVQKHGPEPRVFSSFITHGLAWLAEQQNADGGWGDSTRSISNISTTMLGKAAFHLAGAAGQYAGCLDRVETYLQRQCGQTPEEQAEAIRRRYGKDRTFAVPILTTCALAGLVSWREVRPLPFELACLPQAWFRWLRLPVVSYALPALIAIGQAVNHYRPPRNPLAWLVRRLARRKSLRVLQTIQPSSGGFLEAIPLTSFVTLSLASIGQAQHPVAQKAVQFLLGAVRPDGSWPIDANLATWVTTLSINALAAAGELDKLGEVSGLRDWLLGQQFQQRHPYTGAAPGGWGWTDLPGSVPDADDTPGALLALHHWKDDPVWPGLESSEAPAGSAPSLAVSGWKPNLQAPARSATSPTLPPGFPEACNPGRTLSAAALGLQWLLDLQNSDGGFPTFCRGWTNLPFDRSGSDLTAHALRALGAWQGEWGTLPGPLRGSARRERAIARGFDYLKGTQRDDGSWLPLWFGNQYGSEDENPTYGTARVLAVYRDLGKMNAEPARRGVAWLLAAQNADGGWGGAAGVASSIEETALALDVLVDAGPQAAEAVNSGLDWLVQQVEAGRLSEPTPIGFYFAKLWYFEKLYPIVFTVAALGRALRGCSERTSAPYSGERLEAEA